MIEETALCSFTLLRHDLEVGMSRYPYRYPASGRTASDPGGHEHAHVDESEHDQQCIHKGRPESRSLHRNELAPRKHTDWRTRSTNTA